MKKMLITLLSVVFFNSCSSDRYYRCKINNDFKPAGNSISIISPSDDKLNVIIRNTLAERFEKHTTLKVKNKAQAKIDPPYSMTYTEVVEQLDKVDIKNISVLSAKYKTDYIFLFWMSPSVTEHYFESTFKKEHVSNSWRGYYQLIGNPGNILISSGFFVVHWSEKNALSGNEAGGANDTQFTPEEGAKDVWWIVRALEYKLDLSKPK